jgi:RNA polymerase sigma factor (TIGR02999 family)
MKAEGREHTWQPTVLVHELYLRLVKMKTLRAADDSDGEAEKVAFLSLAGHLMKQLLIEHSRPLAKRAGKTGMKTGMDELLQMADLGRSGSEALAEIENALNRLAALDPKLRTVVELRIFEGLTGNETAERMACAPATVTRYWTFARQWLAQELA